MSAGRLARKLIVKPRDLTTARAVRQVVGPSGGGDDAGQGPSGGGDFGGDFGDFGSGPAPPDPAAPDAPAADGGPSPGWEEIPGRDPFPVFAHEETAREKLAAGKSAADTTYVVWALLGGGGQAPVSEDEFLEVAGEGRVNVTGVVRRPTEGLARIDATKQG